MVHLSETSKVNTHTQPFAYQWDTLVRKHYNKYQDLIDAQTYQLQRTQRLPFALQYPRFYNSELVVLNLLRKKQAIGEVTQDEIDLYKNINPSISSDYDRTFNHNLPIPKVGIIAGAGLFGYASLFNFSIPARTMLFITPIVLDFFRRSSDSLVEAKSSEFLDWVIGYRKAKAWAERYHHSFNTEQAKKVLGHNNLNDLGRQLVSLAQGQK